MLKPMEVVMIQQLAEQGCKIARIARQVGVDRKTVRRALAAAPTATRSAASKPSLLDSYKEFLRGRLEQADFTAQRLFQDIQQQGYRGSYVLVRRFVAPLRCAQARQAVVRFETLPAQQAQVDWAGRFGSLMIDGVRQVISCFAMVLGFSRYLYLEFTTSRNLVSFLSCHQRAFEYFGGVPQEVLYDNLKTAVLSHVDGVVEWQPVFADFAGCYGFRPRACRPYRPETKGKIERPIPYIRSNFFLGREFRDLVDLNAQARQWLEQTANVRVHGTTRQRPAERFAQQERGALRPLPAQPYRVVETLFRSSTREALISYGGNFYSIPAAYAPRRGLRVEVSREDLAVYQDRERIAQHRLCAGKGHRIVDPQHWAGLTSATAVTPMQQKLAELRALGLVAEQFVTGLVKTQTHFLGWQVNKLEETLWKFGPEQLQEAMQRAVRYEAFDVRTLQNICQQQRAAHSRPAAVAVGEIVSQVLAKFHGLEVAVRELNEYEAAVTVPTQEVFPWTA